LGLAKLSSQALLALCPTMRLIPLPKVEPAAQCENSPVLSLL
jgi:hypothetical protein